MLQGRIFSGGKALLAPPAVAEAFAVDNVILTADRWCGKYPPGFPLLLAAGWLAGAPWLVNPLLFGFVVYGVFRLGSKLYESGTAVRGPSLREPPVRVPPGGELHVARRQPRMRGLVPFPPCGRALGETDPPAAGSGPARGNGLPRPAGVGGLSPSGPRPADPLDVLSARSRLRAAGTAVAGGLLPLAFLLWTQWRSFGSPFVSGYEVFDPAEGFLGNRHGSSRLADIFRDNLSWYREHLERALGDTGIALLLAASGPREAAETGSGRLVRRRRPLVGLSLLLLPRRRLRAARGSRWSRRPSSRSSSRVR